MALDIKPIRWDWSDCVRGDTFPATNITDSAASTDLSRVRIKIADSSGTVKVTLDSNSSGITINTATAGSWDFTIGAIATGTTEGLTSGSYTYDLETTDASGNVRTEFHGTWEILPQITDA